MDTTTVAKTWVDFGFYVFDSIKEYILPALGGALIGWITPSPQSIMKNRGVK
jgi:hypothetical protein